MTDENENEPLSEAEILRFGPVVEAQVWNLCWVEEKRAPIAVAAGRPKLGKVFNSEGVGKAVLIRPCMSRGKRVRGLAPIYTPRMLEGNAEVFNGWPMYMDHMPSGVAEAARRAGRSVKEIGGQVLVAGWSGDFTMEEDEVFGYQPGAVVAEIWANPVVRGLVGENPAALHTSISAWPTSGKPGQAPWNGKKGMVIEGIRRQPQGSVDFVPRGGAGGRLLLAEGESEGWLEPAWDPQDEAIVVSLAESFYASAAMSKPTEVPNFSEMSPAQLREHIEKNAPHLVTALAETAPPSAAAAAAPPASGLTEADVQAIVEKAIPEHPQLSETELQEQIEAKAGALFEQREHERGLARIAHDMIAEAEGLPPSWKADLQARYAMLPSGPAPALVVEEGTAEDGSVLSEEDVLRARVEADLKHARDLIAEATGKPRVTGEGGSKKTGGDERVQEGGSDGAYWRDALAEYGVIESSDKALAIHGVDKVEGS